LSIHAYQWPQFLIIQPFNSSHTHTKLAFNT
jgi:hypothetical protein